MQSTTLSLCHIAWQGSNGTQRTFLELVMLIEVRDGYGPSYLHCLAAFAWCALSSTHDTVAMQAWESWLYSGGAALVCSTTAQHAAALVTSLDPSIVKRQNTGSDSEELQLLQRRLLEVIQREAPDALYPAAACALADLQEVPGFALMITRPRICS